MSAVQDAVQQLLDHLIASGTETALQVAVYHKGTLIVDAWAAAPGRTITGTSLFPIFSTGKGIQATAMHILVQKGVLALDDRVSRWWPEFAAHGKQDITIRQVLNHTAGMAMMPEHGSPTDVADWDGMCRKLAAMPPFPAPGTARFYHAITYAWLLGETARRADGRDCSRLIQEEIARPLGLDGMFFGLPASEMHRVQDAEKSPPAPPSPTTPQANAAAPQPGSPAAVIPARSVPSWIGPLEDWINMPAVRRACIPASNGFMNARSIARHYAALIGAGVDGIRLISDETLEAALADPPMPGEKRGYGPGYSLGGPDSDPTASFGHGGYGGSNGWADRRHDLAFGFAKARMGAGGDEIVKVVRALTGTA